MRSSYDFDHADCRWFRPMLLAATNAGKHTPANVPDRPGTVVLGLLLGDRLLLRRTDFNVTPRIAGREVPIPKGTGCRVLSIGQ